MVGEPEQTFPGAKLEGIGAQHPFLPRTAIVLTADFVTMDTGTGCVHIAPGHGDDDYSLGRKNGLPILSPVDDHGRFTDEAGLPDLIGKYVFDANSDIVALLRERGMLLAANSYQHSYPYCWRSKTPIIFRAVEQFFIRIDDLRANALAAIKRVQWLPPWGEARISGTVEARPDWVISRQRSWGVPLPVFYSADGAALLDADWIRKLADLVAKRGSNVWFELDDAALARELGLPDGTRHRGDTIDVWIDSGVSHKAVCAARPELRDPADMYLEATDQHRGWFQSSLMTSVALHDRAPYKICITHGFVVDVDGKKISKSSSYSKPMDAGHFVGKHGADIVRLWVSSVNYTDDVPFSEEMFTRLGDTYRRIRNTLRILLGNVGNAAAPSTSSPTLVDRWIMHRLQQVIADCRAAYAAYEFHKVYHTLNQFCAVDLSSLYVDITKDRLYCDAIDSPRRRATQAAMREVFASLTRLLAPILAFTAEEAWGYLGGSDSVHLQTFPEVNAAAQDPGGGTRGRRVTEAARRDRPGGRTSATGEADRQRSRGRRSAALQSGIAQGVFARRAGGIFHPERSDPGASERTLGLHHPHAARQVQPVLAPPTQRRPEHHASRIMRSLRKRGERTSLRLVKLIFLLSLPLYALDQVTKWWTLHSVAPNEPRIIVPEFFALVFVTNTGAAFGSFKNNNLFFIGLSCVALIVVLTLLLRRHPPDTWRDVSLALLLAGVMGNLTDRFLHGHVIDFLLFDLHVPFAHPWPAFNVADACICIAVGCFVWQSFRQGREKTAVEA